MSYQYKKVLYITVMYSDQLHETGKESRWLVLIDSDFPDAAKRVIGVQRVEVRKRRVYEERKEKTE